jgi:hypothetical protein
MSASLIGHSGSSTFRLSTYAVSMSLAGSCFSSESAPGPLYGAFFVKEMWQGALFSSPVSLFDLKAVSSSRSALRSSRRARELSRLAVAPTLRHTPPFPGHTLTAPSTTAPLGAVRTMTIRRSPLAGADQSRHSLVFGGSKDPNHDAVMRIGSEAPKRRTHSSIRHKSQGTSRDSATSNRYRRPVTSVRTRPKLSGYLQRPPVIVPHAKRRRPGQCPPARAATGRSVACAPRPRSWAFEYGERSRCGIDTTSSRRYSSGVEGTATPIESCLVGPGYCPSGLALSLGVSFRSRRVNQ